MPGDAIGGVYGSATDDVDDARKQFRELGSCRQGKINRDRAVIAMGLHRHPTQVQYRHVNPRESP